MADLKLGSQIGGNLIWHQGILELNPSDQQLFYKDQEVITDRGGHRIKGNLTINDRLTSNDVLTNIVTLTSKESNSLSLINSNTMPNDITLTRVVGGITSNWYNDSVSFGHIRSTSVNSSGFGAKLNGKWLAHFDRDGLAYIGTGTNETKYRIYHEGFKPVPADVGAQPVNVKLTNFVNSRVDISVSDITIDGKRALTKAIDTSNNTLYVGYASAFTEIDFQSPARFDNIISSGSVVMHHASPTFTMRDTDARSAFLHTNNSKFYITRGGVNSPTFDNGPNNRHPMTMDLENGDVYFSGRVFGADVQLYGPNNKPTNADLNLVSRAGDTMTGTLQINADELITDNVGNRMMHSGGSNVVGNTVKDLRLDGGSGAVTITSGRVTSNKDLYVANDKVYHQGFKPTPDDVDSLPRSLMNKSINHPELGQLSLIATNYALGRCLYKDIDFSAGSNNVVSYNNTGTGVVHTRIGNATAPNNSKQVIRVSITPANGTAPGFGGFYQNLTAFANKIYVQTFVAKLDIGRSFSTAENSMGNGGGSYFLTSNMGTGKWERYIRVTMCGSTGILSSGGHIYVSGGSSVPFEFLLAECTAYDITDIATPYSDTNKPSNVDLNLVSRAGDTITGSLAITSNLNVSGTSTSNTTNATTLNVSGVATINKVLLSGTQSTEANALTRKDYVDSKVGTAVQSVGATAPIVSSGGANPSISISAATNAAAGSMSAADKAKLDGIPGDALSRSLGGTMTGMLTISRPASTVSLSMQTPSGWSWLELKSGSTVAHIAQNDTAIEGAAVSSLHLRPSGSVNGSLQIQSNAPMRHVTSYGWITIGSANSEWAHFNTDRPSFHFNKSVGVAGEIYTGASYNKRVYHEGYLPTAALVGAHEIKPWITSPGMNANDTGNYTAFTYSNNAPYSGPMVSMGVNRYTMQFNSTYQGTLKLAFRAHNGDNATWNPWVEVLTANNGLLLAGGTITGNLAVNGTLRSDAQVRGFGTGNTFGSAGIETSATATDPSISFHKQGAYAATLRLVGFFFAFVNQDNSAYSDLTISALVANGVISGRNGVTVDQITGAGYGVSLYGTNGVDPDYGLMFAQTSNFGKTGSVQGDWATYFNISGAANRGWIFRNKGTGFAASISCGGDADFKTVTASSSIVSSDWFRTTGDTGWYSNKWGGGIHMKNSTWVQIYGGKKFFVSGTTHDTIQVGGGILLGDGNVNKTGLGLTGGYDASRFQGIFAMGAAYILPANGVGTANHYGIAWTHSNNTNANARKVSGHHMVIQSAGTTKVALGDGGIWSAGSIKTDSDIACSNINVSSTVAATFLRGDGAQVTNIDWNKITGKPTIVNDWINIFNGGIDGRVSKMTIPPQMLTHLNSGGIVEVRIWLNRSGAASSDRRCISMYINGTDGWSSLSTANVKVDMTWPGVSYVYVYNTWTGHGANANSIVSQYQNIVRVDMILY